MSTQHSSSSVTARSATEEPVKFVADARLISVLGEQLIGSEKVGILELVKNAYDAGATLCTVSIEAVPNLEPGTRTLTEFQNLPGPIISVRDNGTGMSREDLVNGWLRPATSRRARLKEKLKTERASADKRGSRKTYEAMVGELRDAHGGRLPLGEKGIGRLATHRLGQHLWLRTKTKDDPLEWEIKINWADFDAIGDSATDLDKIPITLRHQLTTTDYGPGKSGTVICCYGGRDGYSWSLEQLRDIGRAINSLKSPRKAPEAFDPQFSSPHVRADELASPLARTPAPFELVAVVDESGVADLEIHFQPPVELEDSLAAFVHAERRDLRSANAKYWRELGVQSRTPQCGPFLIHVRAWLRVRKWLGPDYDQVTQYLDRFGGITIYRDGLSTLPAEQGAKVDWLELQISHIKKGSNISYYQLTGEVELQQELTLELRDRSSREGMIQTRAYSDLAQLSRAAIDELQFQVQKVRDSQRKASSRRLPLRTIANYAKTAAVVAKSIAESYDFRKDPLKIAKVLGGTAQTKRIDEAADALHSLSESLKLQEEEREGLMEAAGFGLAIGVAVHELGKLASAIISDIRQLEKMVKGRAEEAKLATQLDARAKAILGEVSRLAPLRVTRGDVDRVFSARSAIEAARNAFQSTLKDARIALEIGHDDFKIKGKFGAIAQVFANLLDNAIYWIGVRGEGGIIRIDVSAHERTIVISDSGPGISKKIAEHLFEPFYSEKSPPSGLGLYICRFYLGQCNARIRLLKPSERTELNGAQFLLDFSKSATGES